ncbi:AraC family transcriptional regulator [Clostridium carboxidivorans P7]|uniref:Transcriptional regulator, AraC family n=1 Tax=Clostridium carboxidivorans P7 TaxID=536227 RepID=C6PY70_9CLOT|nr:AraC family transcriptional regulator [Clostridium carboxidivorans]AKN31589.1 AraC family transcriptional regulator [Clostridium carboxidivorans P7]EET85802.1 transcriptional regulator, AraC family [Clostridium carboxidivorans P7]EFG87000.1 transcriptional regulator, AraC family [Clostridium carboxidivorans P7]
MIDKEKIEFRHLNDFYNIDVIQGINVGRAFPKHSHRSMCLGVINRGTRIYSIDKRQLCADKGKVFVVNTGEVHSFKSLDKRTHDYMCICFDKGCIKNILEDTKEKNSRKLFFHNIIDDSHLYVLINKLCCNLLDKNIDSESKGLFLKIIEQLNINYLDRIYSLKSTGNEQRVIKLLKEYIEYNYKENISINQLSQISGLSPYYLIRLFSNEYGFAPHCYQNSIRIRKVKELLKDGKMKMTDIALEVGFADQSHMIKHFKNSVGVTPSQYLGEMKK